MSSDSDHTPKPCKRLRCLISDSSESSSDESVIARIRRKRRTHMKVVSDDDSSDEDVINPKGRRNRNKALESDSDSYSSGSNYSRGSTSPEWESDWESSSGNESDEEIIVDDSPPPKNKKQRRKDNKAKPEAPKSPENVESDESDGTAEKCPICLLSFRHQQIATPSSCDHCFCLLCLTEWSKNINTCPVDRQTFTTINIKAKLDGPVINRIPVQPKNDTVEQVQEDPTYCEVCRQSDREDRLLLCDLCDCGYHLECLTPPMDEVPYDEWYCPQCSAYQASSNQPPNNASIRFNDMMATVRCLGMTYGRREARLSSQYETAGLFGLVPQRLVPRTRQTERVRANIRANRSVRTNDDRITPQRVFDPDQPSTSSGFDSISENSRGRSPNSSAARNFPHHSRHTASKSKSKTRPKATSRKKKTPKRKKDNSEPLVQKVIIKEYGTDGEEREIVSYVKVKNGTTRKCKKRARKSFKRRKNKYHRRACRRIGNIKSVRKRVAIALNMAKKKSANPIGLVSLNNQSSSVPQRTELTNARHQAGIPQLNLFGNNLPLDYYPLGSDDEVNPSVSEEDGISGGNVVSVSRHSASSINAIRRRLALKTRVSRVPTIESQPIITDLLANIISCQELWHSKDTKINLKPDGTLIPEKKNNNTDVVRNNDNTLIKEFNQPPSNNNNNSIIDPVTENTGSSNINAADIVQAPMYNNSRGGNSDNAGGGGSFRGNYHNRGHHGHNRNDYGPPRDSYSGNGPPMYGGPGPRDNFGHGDFHQPPPLLDFGHNRRQPNLPGIHRNRNNHFRNNPGRGRNFNIDRDRDRGGFRPMENIQHSNFQQPNTFNNNNNPNISNTSTAALPSNVSNLSLQDTPDNLTSANIDADVVENTTAEDAGSSSVVTDVNLTNELPVAVATEQTPDAEECDLYSDIEMPVKSNDNQEDDDDDNNKKKDGEDDNNADENSSVEALLPPPIPPSDLLDFEDNMKSDNESDNNDLVIDDTPKDPVNTDAKDTKTDDIYDPFAVLDSDSNDSNPRDVNVKNNNNDEQAESNTNLDSSVNSSTLPPLEPPPMPPEFAAIVDMSGDIKDTKKDSLTLLGTYYNDDDDDDNPNNDEDDDDEAKGDCPNFSIYSSETMDVARHAEQELTQQIGPLEPPPMPPIMPDDDDIIVADVQGCDLADIPEPVDPYIESLQKERQTLSKIPTKKLSIDSRGKITFKIGNISKLNNKLSNLQDQFEDTVSTSMDKDKESKDKEVKDKELKDKEVKDKELKEKEVKDKELKSKDLKDKEVKEKESKDKELKDKELKEKELNEKESELFLMKKVDDEEIQSDNNDDDDDENAANRTTESSKEDKEDDEEEEEEVEMVEEDEEEFVLMKCDSPTVKSNKEDDKAGEKMSVDENEKTADNSSSKSGSDIQASDAAENIDAVVIEEENISLSKSISDLIEEPEELKLRKDNVETNHEAKSTAENEIWESDGAYTPCKDEMPVKDKSDTTNETTAEVTFDTGLEPITPPPKDRSTDDLGARCPTPSEYAGLGTEAISETDEPINFEEELSVLQRKEKELEEGEVTDENKAPTSNSKKQDKSSDTDNNTDTRKKKKSKRDRCKEASEKNKENISSDNQVEWKKISKSTKERSYREKSKNYESGDKDKNKEKNKYRDRSKDRAKKHSKDDNDKKKVKRKELPRYDVRKIVSEKPVRPRKDEYGRDIRDLSLSLSPSRSIVRANRRSHSRLSRSYSPRMNLRKSRSWSRGHRPRSRSPNRSSPYKQSLSRSRKKSLTRDRRSLSRRRSRSPPTNRRNQRVSPARQHQLRRSKKKQSLSRKNRSRTRSWSRSRSRSRVRTRSRSRGRSRSRSRVRMRSRSKSRTSSKSPSKTRSRSRGAKKKDKLKKQKSPSHSRRRKRSRSRSKTPTSKKTPKSRSKRRNKRDSNIAQANTSHSFITRSRSRERSYSHDRNHSRNWNKINDKDIDLSPFGMRGDKDQQVSANAAVSWSAQWTPSWSRSRSRTPIAINKQRDDHLMQSHNWSPTSSSIGDLIAAQSLNLPPSSPPSQSSMLLASMSNAVGNINGANPSAPTQLDNIVSPKNLTVILRNKDANKSKKKKDKRSKEKKKSRDVDRRKSSNKRNRTPPPSKEVFASGDNILVSVCFNNENTGGQSNNMSMNLTDTLPLLTTAKRRRREPIQPDEQIQPAKKPKKDKSKDKKSRPSPKVNKRDKKRKSKAAEIAATKKPVAVIDLDQSPFREQTLSPQDVIVLSDDDNVGNNDNNNINNSNNGNNGSNEERNNTNIMNSSHDNTINTSNNSEHNNISNDNNNGVGSGNNQNNDVYDDDDEDDRDHDEDNGMFMFANQQQDDNNQLGKGDDKTMQQEHQQMKLLQQKRLKLSEHEQFMIQGPKTPPEPQVKFSISKQQSNLRSIIMHPLFNRDRDDEMEIDGQMNINTNVSRGKEGQGVQNEIFDENDSVEINNRLMSQDQAADKSMELDQEEMGDDSNKKGDGHQVADDEDGEQDDEDGEDEEEDREDDEDEQIKGDGKGMGDEAKKQSDKEKRMDDESDRDKSDKKASKSDNKNSEVIDLCKIGPNTPPEPPNSPLTSPDVYDPFDPTKSRSPTPSVIEEPHLPSDQKHANKGSDLNTNNEKQEGDKPKVISMVTIKRALSPEKAAATPAKALDTRIEANMAIDLLNQNSASAANISCFTTINPVLATVAAAVQRSGMFNLNNPSAGYGITAQRNTAGHINRLSPSSQLKQQRANERVPQLSNLFGNSVKNINANSRLNKTSTMDTRNSSSMLTNNGGDLEANDATIDTSSPYSPGSSLSDGIFDPPSPARNHHSPPRLQLPSLSNLSNINKNTSNNTSASKNTRSMTDKKDIFDSLFDSSPIVKLNSNKLRNINKKSPDKRKKMGNSKIGVRMDENQLQILDDLPSSAVEMQVKDKFLKKLNRQERVVEEVKLVLKPHYTKKHINKDEYKDIMRKAVPKICHNKSGEINPKKIAHLVEAYVKRCRNNKRKSIPEIITKPSATMTAAATNKNLRLTKTAWS